MHASADVLSKVQSSIRPSKLPGMFEFDTLLADQKSAEQYNPGLFSCVMAEWQSV